MRLIRPTFGIAAAAMLALALCVAGARAASSQSPAEFFKVLFKAEGVQQFDRVYGWLDPAQARYVNKTKFVGCMQDSNTVSYSVVRFRVLDQYATTLRIPGTPTRTRMLALTVRVKIRADEDGSTQTFTRTLHTRSAAGHWRWMMALSDIRAYRSGKCPPD